MYGKELTNTSRFRRMFLRTSTASIGSNLRKYSTIGVEPGLKCRTSRVVVLIRTTVECSLARSH